VFIVTTADRVDSVGYRAWAPPVAIPDDDYVGKHRGAGGKSLSLHRMFYRARHLTRGR
jgi:hypothetical protein